MIVLRIFVYGVAALMMLPILVTLPVALNDSASIAFPPSALSLRWFAAIFQDGILLGSMARSFWLALLVSVLSIAVSLPSAFVVERSQSRARQMLETWITGPRMIPQLVLALGLLGYFELVGLAESFYGLILAHLVISIPFVFRTLLVSIATIDRRLEASSAVLGASDLRTFVSIVLPQLKTGVISAMLFTFILSFNNVTLALFLSGFGERTLPVEMFTRMYVGGMTPVIPAIAFLLATIGLILFIVLDRTIGVYKFLAGRE
jgi:ABC-type spermidine/putrescine transport system permease subunit II